MESHLSGPAGAWRGGRTIGGLELSFLHCADLHLDSRSTGLVRADEAWGRRMQEAPFEALERIVDLGISEGVDIILFAGDLHDGEERSLRARLAFRRALQRAVDHGIECFVVHGNHDPLSGEGADLPLPQGAHVFDPAGASLPLSKDGRVVVHGVSHRSRGVKEDLSALLPRGRGDRFDIGLLHCNVGGMEGHDDYAPTTLEELRAHGYDYWALGHVHLPMVLSTDPHIVYPGTPQGRDPSERGERGAALVRVRDGEVASLEMVPLQRVIWEELTVDVGGMEELDELISAMQDSLDEVEGPAVVRMDLVGTGEVHRRLRSQRDVEDIAQEVSRQREDVLLARVRDRSRPPMDMDSLREGADLVGDLLRKGRELRDAGRLRELLLERPEARKMRPWLERMDDRTLLELLEEAEITALELLLEGEG